MKSKKVFGFFLLLFVAASVRYYSLVFLSSFLFIGLLVAYFKSEDEAFWLAFFFILSDGFLGFFGPNEAMISVLPGLPDIEVAQFYILLAIVKAIQKKTRPLPFYNILLGVLFVYLIFLIFQSYAIGLSMALNIQFRVIKMILPLFLLFSIPRLMDKEEDYQDLFTYLFAIALTALAAQVITLSTGQSPAKWLAADVDLWFAREATEERAYRGIFSPFTILITYLGAIYFLVFETKRFQPSFLYLVLIANTLSTFLSATRGWVLSEVFVLISSLIFVLKIDPKRIFSILLLSSVIILAVRTLPLARVQINNAIERLSTLEALMEGDATAGGTLSRLNDRSPRILKKWRESPLTGWGFSNIYFEYQDEHVGNQNILLHAGVLGAFLLAVFAIHFNSKLLSLKNRLPQEHPGKTGLLVFNFFFIGLLIIHSSSVQLFGFHQYIAKGVLQAVFFSFAAIKYNLIKQELSSKHMKSSPSDSHEELTLATSITQE